MSPFKMDFHVHSDFSSDSKTPMKTMIENAIEKGVTHLAFTEHIDYDADPSFEIKDWDFDKDRYFNILTDYQLLYQPKIKLHFAAEIGLQKQVTKRNQETTQKYPFDFVLASLHTLDREDVYHSKYFLEDNYLNAIRAYFEAYYENICTFDDFDTLGHLDLYLRYHKNSKDIHFSAFSDYVETLMKKIIHMGKGIELNAGGHRYGLGHNNPTDDFLKLYKSLGGEILTLGSDAHSPDYIADQYEENCQRLKAIGFKYVTTFEKRKAHFHKL